YDRYVVWSRANLPKLSPVHDLSHRSMWGRPPSAALVEPKLDRFLVGTQTELGSVDSRGRLSSPDSCYSPAAFGPLRGLSASAASITGAGPEIPPSFRTRQKCTIIKIEATIGMPMQCQIYDRSRAFASTIEPPSRTHRTSLYGVM